MKKNNKLILIIVISLAIAYLLLTIIYSVPNGKKYGNTVFIGDNTKISVKNGKISIKNEDAKIKKQKVKIYFKNTFIDGYIDDSSVVDGSNAYAVLNENGNYIILKDMLIAHTPDISIKIKEDSKKESTNYDEISDFILTSDFDDSYEYDLDYLTINSLDINDDGIDEYIYSVGLIKYEKNEYTEDEYIEEEYIEDEEDDDEEIIYDDSEDEEDDDEENQKYISIVYLKKDGKYIIIDKNETEGIPVSNIKLSFAKLIDFNNDDNYEFVIEKMMSEYGPYYYDLYSFGSNKFTKIGGE